MSALNVQLQGFTAANRDAQIRIVNQLTGVAIERKPFLDGSLVVRDIDPGNYELEVTHPNLTLPIDKRVIRIFKQPQPTFVPVLVPPDLFRDTPIRDIPDADLGPVQQTAASVRDRLAPIASKSPGEAIRAADWNVLVGALGDLAGATLELTKLVSPIGHAHPEIEEKIGEVQGNIRRFADAFGRSLLELRRDIETASLRKSIDDVVALAPLDIQATMRDRLLPRVDDLAVAVGTDTPTFTQKLASAGNLVLTAVNDIAVASGTGADDFRTQPAVVALVNNASSYREAGTQIAPEAEMQTYIRTGRATGGQFTNLIGR